MCIRSIASSLLLFVLVMGCISCSYNQPPTTSEALAWTSAAVDSEVTFSKMPSPSPSTMIPSASPTASSAATQDSSLAGIRICIDPGHQTKRDDKPEAIAPWSDETKARTASGTAGVASGVNEYEYNLAFSLLLRDALESKGAQVMLTRDTNDVQLSNIERAEIGNAYDAALSLRIHCNGSENPAKKGFDLFVGKTAVSAKRSLAYADILFQAIGESTGTKGGGVHASDNYTGLNWSNVPAILVELGYMSNPEEDVRLQDPAYQQKLIQGIVQGCERIFQSPLEEG